MDTLETYHATRGRPCAVLDQEPPHPTVEVVK
jgi:hypothetical protein